MKEYIKDSMKLFNRDCMEGMAEYPDNYFDLAIVDPPYGIGMSGGNVGYKGFNDLARKEWDNDIPEIDYFKDLFRVSENQIIWGGNYFGLPPTRCYLVWDKGEGFYNRTYAECELAWTSLDKNTVKLKHDPLASGDYKGKIHPTQKPVKLYSWLLQNYSSPEHKILDTHLGSASHAIAWHYFNKGGEFVGYELDSEYFEKSIKRIKQETAQISLF